MTKDKNETESVPAHAEDYYEAVASQEQTCLDDVEENYCEILESEERAVIRNAVTLDERLDHAVEELISGDSDAPPLSEDAITDAVRTAFDTRKDPNPGGRAHRNFLLRDSNEVCTIDQRLGLRRGRSSCGPPIPPILVPSSAQK